MAGDGVLLWWES